MLLSTLALNGWGMEEIRALTSIQFTLPKRVTREKMGDKIADGESRMAMAAGDKKGS